MSVLNNSLLLGAPAGATGYQISRSLRFNSSDSAYCSRVPASAGNRKTWTWAGWVKRSGLGSNQALLEAGNGSVYTLIWFDSNNKLGILEDQGGGGIYFPYTTAVFRDTSAWYHIVVAVDTTQSTSTNRIKIYVNGVQQSIDNSYPSQNLDTYVNSTNAHRIGYRVNNSAALSAYLADIHFIDGQALDPSSFTETDATTGQLIPKTYTGSYGTNGFHLEFADNSAATATTLGKDSAGSNNWTPNNFSVTAGAGNDSLVDVPTSYGTDTGAGAEVRGNYCTWNPLKKSSVDTISNGNLDVLLAGSANATHIYGTWGLSSGKWYWEVTANSVSSVYPGPGICTNLNRETDLSATSSSDYTYMANGQKRGASATAYGASFSANDVIGIALDMDAGTITFYKNGVSQGQAFSGISGTAVPIVLGGLSVTISTNFGQRPFAYTAPSGFKALCTQNLDAGTITTSGSFTGNASADGPFIWLNGVPTAMTINSNAVTFATHADKLSNGFKLRTSSSSYNTAGSNTYSITTTGDKFKYARAQPNP